MFFAMITAVELLSQKYQFLIITNKNKDILFKSHINFTSLLAKLDSWYPIDNELSEVFQLQFKSW